MGAKKLAKGLAKGGADDATEAAAKAAKKKGGNPGCPWPSSPCFTAGTTVETEEGSVPIEDVEVGDWVWAADPDSGVEGPRRVTHRHPPHPIRNSV